jgi:predicted esterase
MPQYLVAIHHPNNYDPSVEGEAMQRESPSTQMSNQLTRRDFAIRTAGFGLAMGLAPAATLAEAEQASRSETSPARTHIADPYSLVDPELLPVLKQFPAFDLSAEMVGKFRQLPGMPPLPAPAPQPVERHIPGPPGAPEVRLWVVDPAPSEKGKPLLLHMHGGGFMMTDPVLMPRLQEIATDCHCVVVSVDYRLAPETRYPGSLEDNYAALKWVHAHAAELGIDRSRIAVGGESAGGGHAASLAIHARDRNETFPSASSCSSTPSWTTERAAPTQRRPPLATLCGLRVPIVLPGARCSVFQRVRPRCRQLPSPRG